MAKGRASTKPRTRESASVQRSPRSAEETAARSVDEFERLDELIRDVDSGTKRLADKAKLIASPVPLVVEPVIERAIEVIGSSDDALRWLGTAVRALDYATPISLLGTSEGIARVQDVLGRMEHGVW